MRARGAAQGGAAVQDDRLALPACLPPGSTTRNRLAPAAKWWLADDRRRLRRARLLLAASAASAGDVVRAAAALVAPAAAAAALCAAGQVRACGDGLRRSAPWPAVHRAAWLQRRGVVGGVFATHPDHLRAVGGRRPGRCSAPLCPHSGPRRHDAHDLPRPGAGAHCGEDGAGRAGRPGKLGGPPGARTAD